MKQLNEIEVELNEFFPALLLINRKNCFYVPAGYFENLSEEVLENIQKQEVNSLFIEEKPFFVPDSYFEQLTGNMLNRIKFQKASIVSEVELELEEIAPFLNEVNKENIYSVPPDYFRNLDFVPIQKPSTAKIGFLTKPGKLIQYMIAASVLFVIGLGTFLYTDLQPKNVQGNFSIEQSLQTVNDREIISYLQENYEITSEVKPADPNFDFQSMIKNVSDDEIRNYLNDEGNNSEKTIKGI